MNRKTLYLIFIFHLFASAGFSQSKDVAAIKSIMSNQEAAWNNGDLDGFMKGYWENDSLKFIGKSGITYGWDPTLERYKSSYPDKATMGKLTFTLLDFDRISRKSYLVTGKWKLDRESDTLSGFYTLLWKKINGEWVIVTDHSS